MSRTVREHGLETHGHPRSQQKAGEICGLPLLEEQIRYLAKQQGHDGCVLVDEALRLHLEIVAIADLDSEDVAETQTALLSGLQEITDWTAHDACDAARSGSWS